MWREWIDLLIAESGKPMAPKAIPVPLWMRLPVALLLVVWGARRDKPWTVVVAAWLAIPAMWWYSSVMLLGILPIRRWQRAGRMADGATTPHPTTAHPEGAVG
jgi:hypothetical protein